MRRLRCGSALLEERLGRPEPDEQDLPLRDANASNWEPAATNPPIEGAEPAVETVSQLRHGQFIILPFHIGAERQTPKGQTHPHHDRRTFAAVKPSPSALRQPSRVRLRAIVGGRSPAWASSTIRSRSAGPRES